MYFLSDLSKTHADFAKQKKQEEKPSTLREKIIGRTNAGKAFRVGAVASALGLGGLALKNKSKVNQILKNPKEYFTTPAGSDQQEMIWQRSVKADKDGIKSKRSATKQEYVERKMADDPDWEDYSRRFKTEPKPNPSFLGSGQKVNWGKIGKVVGLTGGALAVPTGAAYLAGSEKDKEDIKKRATSTVKATKSTLKDARTWVNTLHRVSQ